MLHISSLDVHIQSSRKPDISPLMKLDSFNHSVIVTEQMVSINEVLSRLKHADFVLKGLILDSTLCLSDVNNLKAVCSCDMSLFPDIS